MALVCRYIVCVFCVFTRGSSFLSEKYFLVFSVSHMSHIEFLMNMLVYVLVSLLTSSLGVVCGTLCMRLANGCTWRLVPITINRSQLAKSVEKCLRKISGKSSPKNTMSGFRTPVVHLGHMAGHPASMSSLI